MIRKIQKNSGEPLTPNFSEKEFACRCTRPECKWTLIDMRLVNALEVLRAAIRAPILVRSGYRCTFYNDEIGGSIGSYHCVGKAADIHSSAGVQSLLDAALAQRRFADNGGIGVYEHHLHLDVRGYSVRWSTVKTRFPEKEKQIALG